jgi:hypothetical protein
MLYIQRVKGERRQHYRMIDIRPTTARNSPTRLERQSANQQKQSHPSPSYYSSACPRLSTWELVLRALASLLAGVWLFLDLPVEWSLLL